MSDMPAKIDPSSIWTVLPSSTDWALNIVSTDKYHGAYIKGDGCCHLWEYEDPMQDTSQPSPMRTWYGDGPEDYYDEPAIYRHICDIDEEIARLLALRETAIHHFEQYGTTSLVREEWYAGKPMPQVETMPGRTQEQHGALVQQLLNDERAAMVHSHHENYGIEEKDIDQLASIECNGDMYTIRLRDGRTWQREVKQ